MSATKEQIDKARAACQSPPAQTVRLEPEKEVEQARPPSPLTIGGIVTVKWKSPKPRVAHAPRPNVPKVDIDGIAHVENITFSWRRKFQNPNPPNDFPAGFSYNYLSPPPAISPKAKK